MSEMEKPKAQEEEYFLREDIEKLRKLALQQAAETESRQRTELQQLHYMKCPKCGMDLHTLKKGTVEVDTCFNCNGVWLDAGELEQMVQGHAGREHKVIESVLNLFKRT